MRSHEIDYEILGDDMQVVEVELDPQETVIAEAGAMNWMEEGITYEAKMGDGSTPQEGFWGKVAGAAKRVVSGESLFITHFTHNGAGEKRVAFAAPYPGKIIPLDLAEIGGQIFCQKNAFLCAALGTKLDIVYSTIEEGFQRAEPGHGDTLSQGAFTQWAIGQGPYLQSGEPQNYALVTHGIPASFHSGRTY